MSQNSRLHTQHLIGKEELGRGHGTSIISPGQLSAQRLTSDRPLYGMLHGTLVRLQLSIDVMAP